MSVAQIAEIAFGSPDRAPTHASPDSGEKSPNSLIRRFFVSFLPIRVIFDPVVGGTDCTQ
jgi:hypothetical protein